MEFDPVMETLRDAVFSGVASLCRPEWRDRLEGAASGRFDLPTVPSSIPGDIRTAG